MGFTMTESKTNFLFIKKDGLDGTYLYQELKKRGVLVETFKRGADQRI